MYITKTTKNVINLFNSSEELDDNGKLKLLIYIFNEINNKQLNSKNEANPDLIEDNDLVIFSFADIGMEDFETKLLNYFMVMYNHDNPNNQYYEDSGYVTGVNYTKEESKIISKYEELSFDEKLDALAELIIRYDNETLLKDKSKYINFKNCNGYEIGSQIIKYKETWKEDEIWK